MSNKQHARWLVHRFSALLNVLLVAILAISPAAAAPPSATPAAAPYSLRHPTQPCIAVLLPT